MDNSLALYLREIGKYPLLNKEEELHLGELIKKGSPEEAARARETMIQCNLRLVVSTAKKFKSDNHRVPLEDLIADGNLGLIAAVEKYDYTLGYRFSTCAVPWIQQAIAKSIIDKSRLIRIPAHIVQQFNNFRKALDSLAERGVLDPTDQEIANEMKCTLEDIANIREWKQNTASLETPIGDEEGNTLEDICADNRIESPADYTEKSLRRDFIEKLLEGLDDRTCRIFKLRFGLGTAEDPEEYQVEHTLEEIGDILTPTITRERVRQIVTQQIARWKLQYGDSIDL